MRKAHISMRETSNSLIRLSVSTLHEGGGKDKAGKAGQSWIVEGLERSLIGNLWETLNITQENVFDNWWGGRQHKLMSAE